MKRMKKRIFAGATCDQIVYWEPGGDPKKRPERVRFKDEAERAQHRKHIALRRLIGLVNNNFSPTSWYVTLTFDNAHECHDFAAAKLIRANYIRRLRYKNPDVKVIAFLGLGDSTSRIHMHAIIEGATKETITELWPYGSVTRILTLHENCKDASGRSIGRDYTGLATYLFEHWTEQQGGHYYAKTRNLQPPEEEEAVEAQRVYTPERPPIAPKGFEYIGCTANTPYGYQCFHYVRRRFSTPCRPGRQRPSYRN